ncbi:AAA family ATPase [Nocardia sp. NPDC059091]|uniref:helix-turn-helix transcriptional regulator n=1 Tax=Nocardia sp. NPDC059091 TaxID=3346724 RepID=UPI0036B137DD
MSTEFIGRERELADLRRRWEQAAHGTPRLIICRGEAGIGKTRLASELTTWVRTRGGRTLWARALEARDAPPFGLWRQAFDASEPDIEDPATGRTRLFDGFADRLTGDEPVLLVLDDIHWADEPSLLALRHIVRGWRDQRILVCANARDTSADAEAGWRAVAPELLREPVTDVLDLTGLSHGSSAACLSAAAERAVPDRITAAAYRMSGGNPFYLRELGRSLLGAAAGDELRLPATLREVVRGRLATVPPRAQELLRAVAILDDAFPVAIAARLIGRPVLECLPALDAAVASGLLVLESPGGTVRFTHALWFADQPRPYRDRHVVSGAGNAHYFGPVPLWLGKFAAALGDSAAAERELRTALEICRDTGAQGFVVEASTDLTAVLLARGATEEALALAKAALPQAESIGMSPWTDRLRSLAAEASARAVLSPREREVAQLVAAGLSNREIATALVLSERTAQNHAQHILTKLGFTNRAQIVAWVNNAARGPGAQAGLRPR